MDIKTIKHVSGLARIKLTEKEEEKMKTELSSILGYVEQLNNVNTEGIAPLYQTTGLVNSVREDNPPVGGRDDFKVDDPVRSLARPLKADESHRDLGEATSNGTNEKLIGQAPDKQNVFVRVKSILNR